MVKKSEIIKALQENTVLSSQEVFDIVKDTVTFKPLDRVVSYTVKQGVKYWYLIENKDIAEGIINNRTATIEESNKQETKINKFRTWKDIADELELTTQERDILDKSVRGECVEVYSPEDIKLM